MKRPRAPTMSDPRIEAVLELLTRLAGGELEVHLDHSGEGDVVDAIIESVNMLAEELRASRAELEQAHQQILHQEKLTLMGQLCGGVAHELRNPLGALRNASYFLRMALEQTDPEVEETLQIIDQEVGACEGLVDNLLDFARPRTGGRAALQVNEIIDRLLVRVPMPPSVTVVRRLDPDLPELVADEAQLEQALGNIVRNAVQAMEEQESGQLEITSTVEQGEVLLSIADSGPGIPPDRLAHLFEPLYTTRARGIGLGLSVTRGAVERHGGSVTVHSVPGRGATFVVRLPLEPAGEES